MYKSKRLPGVLLYSALAAAVQAGVTDTLVKAQCEATSFWPGWNSIEYAFVFGDSYSSTYFNITDVQPSSTNPLGNPPYPGYGTANGPNWVDFLTVKWNDSLLLTYNLAYGGATINSTLVAPYLPTVLSVAEQVEDEWLPTYSSQPASAPWSSDNTVFAIFDGINDVGNSWFDGLPATTTLNAEIFAVYRRLVDELYSAGARNFVFINVPPFDRSPSINTLAAEYQAEVKADILAWNTELLTMAQSLKDDDPDVNVFTVDSNEIFTEVLDDPASFPQTALYQNTTEYCIAYENGTSTEDYYDATCYFPVNEYFWLNSLHPTYPIHDVLAEEVAAVLDGGPNIC